MRQVDIEVIDDFVSPSYLKELQTLLTSTDFHWHFQSSQSLNYSSEKLEDFGFSQGIVPPWEPNRFLDTGCAFFIAPLIYQIKDNLQADNIMRCRLDMTVLHKPPYLHPPHIDIGEDHVACIVYINETDGDTVIYDKKLSNMELEQWKLDMTLDLPPDVKVKQRILPKPGRVVLFNGRYAHTGHSPSEHQSRILINSVFT